MVEPGVSLHTYRVPNNVNYLYHRSIIWRIRGSLRKRVEEGVRRRLWRICEYEHELSSHHVFREDAS